MKWLVASAFALFSFSVFAATDVLPPAIPEPADANTPVWTDLESDGKATQTEAVYKDVGIVGLDVVVVSDSQNSSIDFAKIVSQQADGTYTALYNDREIPGFKRSQIGLITGCLGKICVGKKMNYQGRAVKILARLPSARVVIETQEGRLAISGNMLSALGEVQDLGPLEDPNAAPTDVPAKDKVKEQTPKAPTKTGRRYKRGQEVLYVSKKNAQVIEASVVGLRDGRLEIETFDGEFVTIKDQSRIGVYKGCAANEFCVGDEVETKDRKGVRRNAEIVAIQNSSLVVLRIANASQLIGNWPVKSLRK